MVGMKRRIRVEIVGRNKFWEKAVWVEWAHQFPGREVVQVRVDFDPGVAFGKHSHPGEEIVYVIEGSLEYEVEGKPPVTLKAGDVLFIPAGTIHAAKNVGSGNGAELATYVVEKGKPLVVMAE